VSGDVITWANKTEQLIAFYKIPAPEYSNQFGAEHEIVFKAS
jgi:hypothetical protein